MNRRSIGSLLTLVFAGALLTLYLRFVWPHSAGWPFEYKGTSYELLSPRWIGIGLLAPYFLFVLGRSLADLPWPQRALSLVLRVAFVLSLGLGLSRLTRTTTSDKVCTVFLVDVSDSVPDEALDDARLAITKALSSKRADGLVRLVTFAREARVVILPDDVKEIPRIERHGSSEPARTAGPGSATNIAAAMRLGYGLLPADYLRRMAVFSDGVQTDGDVLSEAARARAYGVHVFTFPYTRPVPAEVALRELRVPDQVRVGEPFEVRATVFSSREQEVKLTLRQGEAINGLDGVRKVNLRAGDNDVAFKSVVRVAGEVTYALDLNEATHDRFRENNHMTASVIVPGPPTVLYVEGNPARANYLQGALTAQQFDVDVRGPRELPAGMRELERYDFVIVSDTPADGVSLVQQEAIEQYMRDLGGGFLFAGGPNGYSLGGWANTTFERILPVRMDADKRREEPAVAMSLVIDRSGSMTGLPLEMAKQAAKAAVDVLAQGDLVEVIAFDGKPVRVVRLTAARHRSRIQNDIAKIVAGDDTQIFPALDAAYQTLGPARAKRKHAILLTDGVAPTNGIRELVTTMAAEGITVTSVGLGPGVDESLLKMISEVGRGRFYRAADPNQLPKIFTRETELVSRQAAIEEYFQPKVVGSADFLRSIDMSQAPFLHGYVATKMKQTPAQEILQSDVGEPILARWRIGLGWSLAWTSDVKNLWAVEWLRWPGYGQFWGQLIREHMRQKKRQVFDMRAEVDAARGTAHAVIDAIGGDDSFQNGLDGSLTVTGPDKKPGKLHLTQNAPGRYEVEFPLPRFGAYVLHGQLERSVDDGKGGTRRITVAESYGHVTHAYPREYLALAPDTATLRELANVTGGELNADFSRVWSSFGETIRYRQDVWSRFVWAALVFFALDLLIRRIRIFDRKVTLKRPVARAS